MRRSDAARATARSKACALIVVTALTLACDRVPSASRSEWTPQDHAGEGKGKQGARVDNRAGAAPGGGEAATSALGDLVWLNQCANCHGNTGRGDGPMGPSTGARDLTASEFQSRATPELIATTIRNGKGRMPKFDVPNEVVDALVQKVRTLR
jgi:mono/diheme cytochrome c family protein